jgi:CrcB protein
LTLALARHHPHRVMLMLVALGGAAGSVTRYFVDGWVLDRTGTAFPYGTLVINLSGSFVLGVLAALTMDRALLPAEIRGPLMIGFLGAYTTFSTLMLESWRLLEGGQAVLALVNAAGSVAIGLVAVGAGLLLGRALG